MASKNLLLATTHWAKTRGHPPKANQNSGDRCAACRYANS